ncbi:helix-turn-helix domain-containing protein [Halobium salinum]|uniref:Helix-turn-helix domain-containing protein n=1 Tax=Halobium salinum TaxID=1364940 RepID=A0ABD5PFC7_9EURY|nr:helix-turn-helix domain-containing protein [Halobium salinum]
MSVIADLTVSSESFLLPEALSAAPEVVVELQPVVAHADDGDVPYFWVRHGDRAHTEAAIRDDPTVEDVVLLDETDRGASYRARWTEDAAGAVRAYLQTGSTILEATGRADSWQLRMRFDDDEALAAFHGFLRAESVAFELEQLYHPDGPVDEDRRGLTALEHETLTEAFERGYYEVPRRVSMTDLADEMGTSQQTLSKRFRRAHAALIESGLSLSSDPRSIDGDRSSEG